MRKGGNVSVVGVYGPIFSMVKFGNAMNKGLTLRMNQCPVKRQWPRLIEHIRNGHLKPSDIITHRIPLEDIAEAYHIFSSKLDDCIKPLIVPTPPEEDEDHDLHRRQAEDRREQRRAARPHPGLGRRPRPERPAVRAEAAGASRTSPARTGTSPNASPSTGRASVPSSTSS